MRLLIEDGVGDRAIPRWVLWVTGALATGLLLYALRGALAPLFFAFLIAYMLDPVVDRFEARGLSRGLGIAVMLTIVLGALAVFLLLAVPAVVREVGVFMSELPHVVSGWRSQLEPYLADLGVEVPDSIAGAADALHIESQEIAKVAQPAGAALRWLLGGTFSVLGTIVGAIMVPVFAAYLLHDFDPLIARIRDLVPTRWREDVVALSREADDVLSAFMRGQVVVMAILSMLYAVAYGILGVRLALPIAVCGGLLSFIPYVGGAVALGLAIVMCLVDGAGWGQFIGVIVAYSAIQVLEGFVVTPKIVGDKVGLSAVWVLFALTVGGELFGFAGVLLALPAAAVIKIFVVRGTRWYMKSSFFLRPAGRGVDHENAPE